MLESINVYGQDALSRERLDWDLEREEGEVTAASFLPNSEDNDLLSERVLGQIAAVMDIADDLPSIAQCHELYDTFLKERDSPEFGVSIPAEYGEKVAVNLEHIQPQTLVETQVEEGDVGEVDEPATASRSRNKSTMYEINNSIIDVPWHVDLACHGTLKALAKYGQHLRSRALRRYVAQLETISEEGDNEDANSRDDGNIPIMYTNGIVASGDGSPAFGFSTLMDADPIEYHHFVNNFGPFHAYMEFMKKSKGSFTRDTLWDDWIRMWRPSDKAADFALMPSDPSQPESEFAEAFTAVIYVAILNIRKNAGGH
eukprot:scaffold58394_cov104-Attheya_sp.AAC.1